MPVIMAGLDHRTVWRFTGAVLGQGFLHARCCATCVLVQTVFYTVAFPQLQFITVVVVAFTLCSLFIVGRPVLPSVYTAWTIAGSAVLGQVVLARRCTTPGAVYVRAVRSVARGDTIGAVLGRGLGHYDKCRGPDSAQCTFSSRSSTFLLWRWDSSPLSWWDSPVVFPWWSVSLLCWCNRLFLARGNSTDAVIGQVC